MIDADPWDDDKPTPEMFVRAYTYNNKRLLRLGLTMWQDFVDARREEKANHLRKTVLAIRHRRRRSCVFR